MPRLNSVAFRLIAAAVVVSLAGLIAGGLLLSNVFRASVERQLDDRLIADMENLIAAAEPAPNGELVVMNIFADQRYDTAFSGWYWQVTGEGDAGQQLTSRSLWDKTLSAPDSAEGGSLSRGYTTGPEGQQLRYLVRRISFPDMAALANNKEARPRIYQFAVAADRSNSQAEAARFDATLLWALGAMGAFLILATLIQVRVGLSPLRVVRDRLAAIRAGKAQRLTGSFPAEIAPLAEELNALLAHNAEVVQRARTHVGNLAHGLKTPLSVLTNEAVKTSGPLAEAVMKQADVMRRQVDHYLARARAAASAEVLGVRTEAAPVIGDLARTLEKIHGQRGIEIETDIPADLAFRGERQDFEELAGNLIDNACKWARTLVRVSGVVAGGSLVLSVEDDGPGLDEAQIVRVLEKRERLDESVPGSGLGLGIVRDIADLYGGKLALSRSAELGGLTARLELPAA
ncbi:Adaptive-response sensory-kinase SasA [Alphaproteobacteria bacterium SO-S41]|nr:Adaptive-response sensory-kinase SasA [Alphaproteobacteria bacterium SO-S41]